MPEEKVEIIEQKEVLANPYSDESWSASPIVVEGKKDEVKTDVVIEEKKEDPKKEEDVILDEDNFIKTNLGYDNVETAKKEIELLKQKAETPAEIKFANDESKRLYDAIQDKKDDVVWEILDTKRKLSSVDKLSATEVLKLHIEQTNKHFKSADINDVFDEKYAYPEKPTSLDTDLDGEFEARLAKWDAAKEKIDRRIERDAVTAKEELAKLNTELTLPDIKKEADPKLTQEAQQKELERMEGIRAQYLKVLDNDFSKFNGYEVKAKDGEVEVPVAYVVTDQQKSALRDELKDFDVDGFIGSRWFNKEDGSPNISQMMDDIFLLRNRGDIFQKIANEAASKRLVEHLGTKSNIDVTGKTDKTFSENGNKNGQQQMAEFFWNQP